MPFSAIDCTSLHRGSLVRAIALFVWFALTTLSSPVSHAQKSMSIDYPSTAAGDTVDDYFGRTVKDPYRWLEDTESTETRNWITAQNVITDAYLDSLPMRDAIAAKLETFWNYERYGLPKKHGDHYLYFRNDGLQNQSVLYKSSSLDAPRQPLIDPNTLSDDGTMALSSTEVSEDGKYVAYGLADGGSDWRTWKVRDVASGNDTGDVVQWVKFSSIAWKPDGSGFFYARYASPEAGEELLDKNENQELYFHTLGQPQSEDTLIYRRPDHPKWGFSPIATEDGQYLIIHNWKGSEPKSQVFVKRLNDSESPATSPVEPLITGFDADYNFVAADGDRLFFSTDDDAPRQRLIAVNVDQPAKEHWTTIIPQSDDVIESVSLLGDVFYVTYLKDAKNVVLKFGIDGTPMGQIDLPGVGSVSGFDSRRDADETFFKFENYVTPTSIYRLDLNTGAIQLWREPAVEFDVHQFVTEQTFATSKDGTRIPVTITRRTDTTRDGNHPTLLYGYGGFNISILPRFSPAVAAWIDDGGIYAVATLRGGGEYGRQWHEDGMRLKKQNVFDDCIAAAEILIEQNYCTASTLALSGRSNGGLLVGAVMTQRPDLFGAALPAVGVMDMLRYHKFTIGWAWATEYGSSDEEDQIDNLLSYSPLHNIKPGVCYPATLITTADRDDRVVPGHSFKFAATLQTAQAATRATQVGCENPTLIRIETRAGHGAGTPVSKLINEYADTWSFLRANLKPQD